MNEKSDLMSSVLEWERKKFVKLAQIGFIVLIMGLFIYRVIYVIDLSGLGLKAMYIVATLLFYAGILLLTLSMFTISINDKDLHTWIRVALIIAIAWIITQSFSRGYLF